MTHIAFERLSELAESDGGSVAAADETRHLASCSECRDTVVRVRALLVAASALPREVAPPADAWSGIRARVSRRTPVVPSRLGRWIALAASVVLIVGAALLVPGPGTGRVTKAKGATSASAAVSRVDMRYLGTVAELRASLEEQRARFGPVAAEVVDQSLAVIDTAIAETRAALASDPHNPSLVEILSANYQRKIELLQRATELARSS